MTDQNKTIVHNAGSVEEELQNLLAAQREARDRELKLAAERTAEANRNAYQKAVDAAQGAVRPKAPGPTTGAVRVGVVPAGGRFPDDLKPDPSFGGVFQRGDYGNALGTVTHPPVPSFEDINETAERLSHRLHDVLATARMTAAQLAGIDPGPQPEPSNPSAPARTIFEAMARVLDEMHATVDNIQRELSRARSVLP